MKIKERIPPTALIKTWRKPNSQGSRTAIYSYLAGFFDGEGHIIANHTQSKTYPTVLIGATNTDPQPIKLLVRMFRGRVTTRSRKLESGRESKLQYQWACTGPDAHWALTRMLPWLLIKRRKAQLAIRIIQNSPGPSYIPTKYELKAGMKAYKELGIHEHIDNPERYSLVCAICGKSYKRRKNKGITCSRRCTSRYREQLKRERRALAA